MNSKSFGGHNPASGEWNDSLSGDFVWSNVNVGEVVPNVMTPLAWSILAHSFRQVSIVPDFNVMGNICGRPYNNTSLIFWMMRLTGRNAKDYGNELGISYSRYRYLFDESGFKPRISAVFPIIGNIINVGINYSKALPRAHAFTARNPEWCKKAQAYLDEVQNPRELYKFWSEALAVYGISAFLMVFVSAMEYTGQVGKLRRRLDTLVGPEDASRLLSSVSSESELLASLGPVVGAWRVYRGEWTRDEFDERFGHRQPHEGDYLAPDWEPDRCWLEHQLAYFAANPVNIDELLARQRRSFEGAWERLQSHHPQKAPSIRKLLDKAAAAARLREAVRSEFVRMSFISRRVVELAGEFTGLEKDIYFLSFEEIWDLLRGYEVETINQIPVRRKAYETYRSLPPYPTIIRGHFDLSKWLADPNRRTDFYDSHLESSKPSQVDRSPEIRGMAGSAGKVEGQVRVIDCLDDGDQLQAGEILVTSQTNVGWTPLFPRLAAVVTDIGAPLSHAAIVARELGIPAVVGCQDATLRLKTGDRVLVDGARGIVEILS
jgi:phosphohistidine swiveling domain-containing protein